MKQFNININLNDNAFMVAMILSSLLPMFLCPFSVSKGYSMFDIAFGLLFAKILNFLFFVLLAVLVLPFVMNVFNGRGYRANFAQVRGWIAAIFRFGTEKR